jgi:hypothetical protein
MRVLATTAAAVLAAVGAQPTSITMKSTLGSKLRMGGAVINSYCESDLQVGFSRAYVKTEITSAGIVNDVFLGLENVRRRALATSARRPAPRHPGGMNSPALSASSPARTAPWRSPPRSR